TNLTLGPKSAAPLRDLGPQVLNLAPAVSVFLKRGIEQNTIREKQITITIVYGRPGNLSLTDEENRKFISWPLILEQKVSTNPAVRVVRLPEARSAAAESTLVLSGLVDTDPEAVTQVADYYVWATAERLTVFHRPAQNGKSFEHFGRYKISVWDGRSEPKTILATNAPNASAFAGLSDLILEQIKSKPTGAVLPGVREKISAEWTRTALAWNENKYFDAENYESRLEFNHLLRVFELASFVNPADPLPQEQSLFLRFNGLNDHNQARTFPKSWAASEAWGAYLDRFGPQTHRRFTGIWRPFTVAASAIQWPANLIETIPDHVGSDLGHGAPLDASNALKSQWRLYWLRELARRAKLVASQPRDAAEALPWISSLGVTYNYAPLSREELRARLDAIEALKPVVAELALVNSSGAASYEKAFKALRKELGLPDASLALTPAGSRRARLPRFDEVRPRAATITLPVADAVSPTNALAISNAAREMALTNEVLAWPSLTSIAEGSRGELIRTPNLFSGEQVVALMKSGGQLFVALEQKLETQIEGEARDLKQTAGAAVRKSVEFFRVETKALVPAFGAQRFDATNIVRAGDSFLFMTSNRVARVINGKLELGPTFNISRPIGAAAATADDFFALAFFSSDAPAELTQFDLKTGSSQSVPLQRMPYNAYGNSRILAANDRYLCLSRGALEIFDRVKSSWSVSDLIPKRALPPGSRIAPYPATFQIVADEKGAFWIAGEMGVAYINPSANNSKLWPAEPAFVESRGRSAFDAVLGAIESARQDAAPAKRAPRIHTRISANVVHVAFDGKFAWLALTDGSAILLDPDAEQVAQRVFIGGYPRDFAFADNALWISAGSTLFKRDVKPASSLAASEWTPVPFSPAALDEALAKMRVTERAALLLMDGEREKARAALAPNIRESVANTQAIHLLLMALTFDPSFGETARRAAYLEKITNVPGPIGAFAQTELERLRVEEPNAELFAKYDNNHDGYLNDSERVALAKDPSRVDQADSVLTVKMRAALERVDLNRDGTLNMTEMLQARHTDPDAAAQLGFGFGIGMGSPMSVDANHDGNITLDELVARAKTNTVRFSTNATRRFITNGPPRMLPPGGPRRFTNGVPTSAQP
ncbi:MAG TPA: EF-hand domain-containing protein, partial [Verrucomicrobiae bacterium]|nr:EF-hand domain-containing protein [Verrucomicrobiae bacterium]